MADPAAAAHEHHRHVRDVDHRHAVVAGAARELEDAIALARDGIRQLPSEPRRAGHGAIVVGDIDLQRQLSALGDTFDLADDVGHRKLAVGIRGGADIDRERYLARNDIGRTGHRMDVPDSPDQPIFVGPAERLDRNDAFRGTCQRIAPQQHRHGAGMPGHAGETCRKSRRARYRRHHPDRQTLGFQHRALLDVEFQIGKQFAAGPCGRADMVGIETESGERIAHRCSGAVPYTKHALVERAGDRAAPQQRGSEPNAFLIGKACHLDGEGPSLPALVHGSDTGNRRDQTQRPIPFAGIAHRVVMRPQHQAGQARTISFVTPADVSDGVEVRNHSCLLHPRQQQIGRGAMFGGEKDAGQMGRCLGYGAQGVNPAHNLLAKGRVAVEIAGMFGIRHSNRLEPDLLGTLPEHGLAEFRQPIQPGCQRDEMVAGELTHFAGEVYPAIGQQNLGLADAARIKDDLTRRGIAGVVFIPDAKVEIAERKPDALAAPPDMDHLTFERHRAAKRGTGLGRQLIFETCLEREVAGTDNELVHPMGP